MPARDDSRPRRPAGSVIVISFDCLGTLVDWDRGLREGLMAHANVVGEERAQILVEARHEAEWRLLQEIEEFVPYRRLLADSLVAAGLRTGSLIGRSAAEAVAGTLPDWPYFDDAAPALARLAQSYRLAFVSNADRADLAALAARLPVPIAHLVAADDVACFKPEPDHLMALLHELELEAEELLHVSAFAEYDLATAADLGIEGAYVDRRGEPVPEDLPIRHRVRDLAALAARLSDPPRGAGNRRGPAASKGSARGSSRTTRRR